jgi:hypothetical protein
VEIAVKDKTFVLHLVSLFAHATLERKIFKKKMQEFPFFLFFMAESSARRTHNVMGGLFGRECGKDNSWGRSVLPSSSCRPPFFGCCCCSHIQFRKGGQRRLRRFIKPDDVDSLFPPSKRPQDTKPGIVVMLLFLVVGHLKMDAPFSFNSV